jgi:5-methylcytosine-specific restriction endonuclease McrA
MHAEKHSRVLVLNRLWQAVNCCSVERAMTLLFTGNAQVVYEDGGTFNTYSFREWCDFSDGHEGSDVVRTISFRIRIPKIIVLLVFDRFPRKDVKFTRQNVFLRDKNICQYCGRKFDTCDLNLDHVVPKHQGGQTTWTNIVCSCLKCNSRKANRTPAQAGMHLVKQPKKPHWRPFIGLTFSKTADHSWRHFVDLAYWNVELGEE